LFIAVLLGASLLAFSQDTDQLRQRNSNQQHGIALSGYDPVAYFTVGQALRGRPELACTFHGLTYYFATASNRALFVKQPDQYEPQYGGWCAYAMGKNGTKVEVDPQTFKIVDGKLFLFYNKFFNNTLKTWNQDEQQLRSRADANWKKLNH